MRTKLKTLALALALCGAVVLPACKHPSLEPGGAYAPTNTVPAVQADYAFFVVDSAYDLAYSAIDAAFKFERENRQLLWNVSPNLKHSLDNIRPQAVLANTQYLTARAEYLKNPTPWELTILQSILAKMQQLAAAASAVLPKAKP